MLPQILPLAITCTRVFLMVMVPAEHELPRLRLSTSLGRTRRGRRFPLRLPCPTHGRPTIRCQPLSRIWVPRIQ